MRKVLADRDVRICLLMVLIVAGEVITALILARVPWPWGKTAETCTLWLLATIIVASWIQMLLAAANLLSLLWAFAKWTYHKLRGNAKQGRLSACLVATLRNASRPVRDIWAAAALANALFAIAVARPGIIPAQLTITAFAPPVILLVELTLSVALALKKTPT